MDINRLGAGEAERYIEHLRYGVPPSDHVRAFTVGRDDQLTRLHTSLSRESDEHGALLLQANYGAGKSHLLRVTRELALEHGYAVALVEVNAQEGIRFNRMDTVLGAVCRSLEVPSANAEGRGVAALFDRFITVPSSRLSKDAQHTRQALSAGGKWDYSEALSCPAMFVALRAWVLADGDATRARVSDWLSNPTNYRGQRKLLYQDLVAAVRLKARDPRQEWQFYSEDVFMFHVAGHRPAWDGLSDLDAIAKASGLKGLVLLFDEFEDVIQNLNRRDLQEQAFLNLFRFFAGQRFPGMAYFAVTPDFVAKCKTELLRRGLYDFDYNRFDELPAFRLEPVTAEEGLALARRIRAVHGIAYGWKSEKALGDAVLARTVTGLWSIESPDRVRRAIQGIVGALDAALDAAR